jgi:hypothetical protein
MITNLAAGAASCAGTWSQKWKCGWNQPVLRAAAHAGYDFGHSLLPVLAALAAVILIARSAKKRKKTRSAAPAGAGSQR